MSWYITIGLVGVVAWLLGRGGPHPYVRAGVVKHGFVKRDANGHTAFDRFMYENTSWW